MTWVERSDARRKALTQMFGRRLRFASEATIPETGHSPILRYRELLRESSVTAGGTIEQHSLGSMAQGNRVLFGDHDRTYIFEYCTYAYWSKSDLSYCVQKFELKVMRSDISKEGKRRKREQGRGDDDRVSVTLLQKSEQQNCQASTRREARAT